MYFHYLEDKTTIEPTRKVLILEAEMKIDEGARLKSGKVVAPFDLNIADGEKSNPGRQARGYLYFPVHEACLHIARHFIRRMNEQGGEENSFGKEINSMRNLWEVLFQRLPSGGTGSMPLPESNEYYTNPTCRGIEWDPWNNPTDGEVSV